MSEKFANIFDTKHGQVLTVLDTNDDGYPSVKVSFKPEGFGVVTVIYGFTEGSEEECWEKAEASFDSYDTEKAETVADELEKQILSKFDSLE